MCFFTSVIRTHSCYEHFHKRLLLEISWSHSAYDKDTKKKTDESKMSNPSKSQNFIFSTSEEIPPS